MSGHQKSEEVPKTKWKNQYLSLQKVDLIDGKRAKIFVKNDIRVEGKNVDSKSVSNWFENEF